MPMVALGSLAQDMCIMEQLQPAVGFILVVYTF